MTLFRPASVLLVAALLAAPLQAVDGPVSAPVAPTPRAGKTEIKAGEKAEGDQSAPVLVPVLAVAGQADFEAGLKLLNWNKFSEATPLFEKAAAAGHPAAMRALGEAFLKGQGIKKDAVAAKAWFDKLEARANAGDAAAAFEMGDRLDRVMGSLDYGAGKNFPAAFNWYSKAAQGGNAPGMRALGFMYMEGHGTKKDAEAAEAWLTRAMDAGDGHACFLRGVLRDKGVAIGVGSIPHVDPAKGGLVFLEKAAVMGYDMAMWRLSEVCSDPKSNPDLWDLRKAQKWALRGTEVGCGYALNHLLGMFVNVNFAMIQDHFKATGETMHWFGEDGNEITHDQFLMRVEKMHVKTIHLTYLFSNLAKLHAEGVRVPRNIPRAIACCERGAELGDTGMQFALASLYEMGEGVPLDYAKAMKWHQAAAGAPLQELPWLAQEAIGRMHAHGQGVPQDDAKAFAWYEQAAKDRIGGSRALANCYYYGRGVKQDIPKAKAMYERIGRLDGSAGRQLVRMWRHGYGVPVDYAKAYACFDTTCDIYGNNARNLRGEMSCKGQGVPKDMRQAAQQFRQTAGCRMGVDRHNTGVLALLGYDVQCESSDAPSVFLLAAHEGAGYSERSMALVFDDRGSPPAEEERKRLEALAKIKSGDVRALTALGKAYLDGDSGFYMDVSEATVWLRQAAERGDPEAMDLLGSLRARNAGEGDRDKVHDLVRKNPEVALAWFQKSADKGFPRAMFNLGYSYENGLGVPADLEKAVAWYAKGAAAGDTFAMIAIAELARNGAVGDADNAKALRWYTAAADKGNLLAMRVLADAYRTGGWTGADGKWAFAWYEKAAAKNDPEAMFRLGLALRNGTTVEADDAKATAWYTKAAELGHSGAMRNLGAAYRDGKGVKEDAKTAWVWFELAARDLAKNAADHRDALGNQMTEAQLTEAKAAADALGKKIWPDR